MDHKVVHRKDWIVKLVISFGLALSAAFVFATLTGPTVARDTICIERWSDAAPVVAKQRLVNIEKLSAKAPKKLGGSIVKATLCKTNGSYTYSLVVRTTKGKLKSMTVDARNPF